MRNPAIIFILLLLLLPLAAGSAQAEGWQDFVVIQPGQPGTSREAQPVMDALAAYLQAKTGSAEKFKGHYFNDLTRATAFLKADSPGWGIVSLGFYLENAVRLSLTPIASTRPGGKEKDGWTLVTLNPGPASWKQLHGTVRGTMLFEKAAASCILFGLKPADLSFELAGTSRPLKSLRATAKGRQAGMVLDQRQYRAMQSLPLASRLKSLLTVADLPTDPVVWVGKPGKASRKLATILAGMRKDPAAAQLLKTLQTDGFGPPDPALAGLIRTIDENCGP